MADPLPAGANPYVGPRTFMREDSQRFFGREREARELLSLVISQRLVLFYAQSGAGKSSLLNTRLAPALDEAGFAVLPVARVGGELPPGVAAVDNIYLFNLMLSLDQTGRDPGRLAQVRLVDFLARLTSDDGERYYYDETLPTGTSAVAEASPSPGLPAAGEEYAEPNYVLIVDQFEEFFTTHPARWQERAAFFAQLDEAMRADRRLWVVLTLREDYVAALDPYAPLMSDKLRARYYMQRMEIDAALDAIRRPAELGGRPFAAGVAEKLADDLCQVRVPGQEATVVGQYVEPVQLQVVCFQLWERLEHGGDGGQPAVLLAGGPGAEGRLISEADLAAAGDVNQALEQFYADTLAAVLAEKAVEAAGVSERALRTWFDSELITETGIRNTVFRNEAAGRTGTLANGAVDALSRRFLLRTELRGGGAWVELVHDRLVEPIRANNAAWFPQHLSTLQRQAALWNEQSRPSGLLLQSQALAEAEAWAAAHEDELELHERDFLQACRQARAAAERERRQSRIIRGLGVAALIISILAIGAAIYAWKQTQQARENAELAEARIAQVGQLVGDLGMARLLSMASQLDQAGDSDGAATLLQTAVNLNPTLLADLDSAKLTTDTLRLLASVSLRDPSGGEYAFIPAGAFTMGSKASDPLADSDEMSAHSVYLSDYWIGRAEVTNEEYAAFVEATGHEAPVDWENGSAPSGKAAYPVVKVSWDDAWAYTQWLSEESGMAFRLCTEAEWEKACRGTDGRIYPWGNTWDASKANVEGRDTTPVGKYSPEGDSPYGVADMSGNVWEWVADWYGKDYYATSPSENPQGPETGDYNSRVGRGGSFSYGGVFARCASRIGFDVDSRGGSIGLRVCVSPGR